MLLKSTHVYILRLVDIPLVDGVVGGGADVVVADGQAAVTLGLVRAAFIRVVGFALRRRQGTWRSFEISSRHAHRHALAAPPPLRLVVLVVVVALVSLAGVELGAVDRLDVLPQGGRVSVPLGAARGSTSVRFLKKPKLSFRWIKK